MLCQNTSARKMSGLRVRPPDYHSGIRLSELPGLCWPACLTTAGRPDSRNLPSPARCLQLNPVQAAWPGSRWQGAGEVGVSERSQVPPLDKKAGDNGKKVMGQG